MCAEHRRPPCYALVDGRSSGRSMTPPVNGSGRRAEVGPREAIEELPCSRCATVGAWLRWLLANYVTTPEASCAESNKAKMS
jgi:hypothetical protein